MAENTTTTGAVAIKDQWAAFAIAGYNSAISFLQAASLEYSAGIVAGNPIDFYIYGEGTPNTTELSETSDGTSTTLTQTVKSATLKEYGDFWTITKKLSETSFHSQEAQAAWTAGKHAGEALDLIARASFDAETGAAYNSFTAGTDVDDITTGDNLTASDVRKAYAKLRGANVDPVDGSYYFAHIHPNVLKDLKDETGDTAWTATELYAMNGEGRFKPVRDEVGIFEGFRFIATTQCKVELNSHATTPVNVYTTYFHGTDAVGMGLPDGGSAEMPFESEYIPPVKGVSDVHGRKGIVQWYSLIGFTDLKPQSLHKFFSASSIG